MSINLVRLLGLVTYISLLSTIISGLFKMNVELHRFLAIATIIFATLHFFIVLFKH